MMVATVPISVEIFYPGVFYVRIFLRNDPDHLVLVHCFVNKPYGLFAAPQ